MILRVLRVLRGEVLALSRLPELRQDLLGEQADIFHRHLERHAAEVEGAGDRGKPAGFAPLVDRLETRLLRRHGNSFFEPVLPISVKWFKDDILSRQARLS